MTAMATVYKQQSKSKIKNKPFPYSLLVRVIWTLIMDEKTRDDYDDDASNNNDNNSTENSLSKSNDNWFSCNVNTSCKMPNRLQIKQLALARTFKSPNRARQYMNQN